MVADNARRVVDAGYESIWVFDCIGRPTELAPDPLTLLSVVATVTEDVELGIGVIEVPLRNTVELAHRVFSAQLICGNRLLLGVGFGSTRADFDAVGVSFDDRARLFDEEMPKLRTLLSTGRWGEVDLSPWPLGNQPPPIMLGTWGRKVEVAARDYDGWIASGHYRNDDELAEAIRRYRAAGGTRAIVTNVGVPADGDLSKVAKRLERHAEVGFDDSIVIFESATDKILREVRALVA